MLWINYTDLRTTYITTKRPIICLRKFASLHTHEASKHRPISNNHAPSPTLVSYTATFGLSFIADLAEKQSLGPTNMDANARA